MNVFSVISLIVILTLFYVFFSSGVGGSYSPAKRDVIGVDDGVLGLDAELQKLEAIFDDIKPETEKKIIWFGDSNGSGKNKKQTNFSVVYLHGFSASRQEVSPLTENIAQALGANLFLTRLTGHGRSNDAMADVTVEELLADSIEALEIGKRIGKRVIVIGTSTGAALATWLAAYEKTDALAAVVLLSPNYGLRDPKSVWLLKPAAKIWLPLIEGRQYEFAPDGDLQSQFWTWRYPTVALIPMMKLVSYVTALPLDNIMAPALVLYSPEDEVVDVGKIKSVYQRLGSQVKQIEVIEGVQSSQHHILAGDILAPATTPHVESIIMSFLSRVIASR